MIFIDFIFFKLNTFSEQYLLFVCCIPNSEPDADGSMLNEMQIHPHGAERKRTSKRCVSPKRHVYFAAGVRERHEYAWGHSLRLSSVGAAS